MLKLLAAVFSLRLNIYHTTYLLRGGAGVGDLFPFFFIGDSRFELDFLLDMSLHSGGSAAVDTAASIVTVVVVGILLIG